MRKLILIAINVICLIKNNDKEGDNPSFFKKTRENS